MKKVAGIITSFALSVALFVTLGASSVAALGIRDGVQAARGTGVPADLFGNSGIITTITNTLLFIAGALAVIMVIFGGLRYATSGGNASSITAAKNTILYAIVGLIIAFLAFAAINFALATITPGASSSGFTDV